MQDRIHQQTNAQDKIQHQQTVGQHNIHAQTKEQDNTKHQHTEVKQENNTPTNIGAR